MTKINVIQDDSASFGDPDTKIIVFCDQGGLVWLLNEISSLGSSKNSTLVASEDSEMVLKIVLSDKVTSCVLANGSPVLYIGQDFKPSLIAMMENLIKYGSFIVINPQNLSEMECIICNYIQR